MGDVLFNTKNVRGGNIGKLNARPVDIFGNLPGVLGFPLRPNGFRTGIKLKLDLDLIAWLDDLIVRRDGKAPRGNIQHVDVGGCFGAVGFGILG